MCVRGVASLQAAWPRLSACGEAHSGPKGWRLWRRQHRRGCLRAAEWQAVKKGSRAEQRRCRVAPHHELIIFTPSSAARWTKKRRKNWPSAHTWKGVGGGQGVASKNSAPNPLKQISIETPLGYSCKCDWLVSLSRRPANNKSWARSLHLSHKCAQGTTHAHTRAEQRRERARFMPTMRADVVFHSIFSYIFD